MGSEREIKFLRSQRVGYLGTADINGLPHVIPVCFEYARDTIFIAIDEKPKTTLRLKRLTNIEENPQVTLIVDHYNDMDWSELAWVMVKGTAKIIQSGAEHSEALKILRKKYSQLSAMNLERLPVICIAIDQMSSWGNLSFYKPTQG